MLAPFAIAVKRGGTTPLTSTLAPAAADDGETATGAEADGDEERTTTDATAEVAVFDVEVDQQLVATAR